MPLKAVAPRRLYRQIADQIRSLVGSGEFAPGARHAELADARAPRCAATWT